MYLILYPRHHRTGTQWKIYPTYDFCAPILDSYEGVTLALRTNEYRDRNAQYEWMQDALGLRKVKIWDFSVCISWHLVSCFRSFGGRSAVEPLLACFILKTDTLTTHASV
jgi:hypothetical protein